jgi:pimeloyl-ACP methyl ester carboxylesterase
MRFMNRGGTVPGDGHAVVFFPGLGADQRYMAPLAKHCKQLGYTCYDWGRGTNAGPAGDPEVWLRELALDVAAKVSAHRQSVSLIGWSLGGVYAREVAKALPQRIRQVITLGSPFANLSAATNVGWLYQVLNGGSPRISPRMTRMLAVPPPVPTSSIYSRSDGVVAWEACVTSPGPFTENIEVKSSHLGLVWHPDVLRIIADRLGQREGTWRAWSERSAMEGSARSWRRAKV